jgi:heme/copper-type cytochrome/quinol oxidase subunit 1
MPLLFLSITLGTDSAFDLQLHDTYFVLPLGNVTILFTFILGILGGAYWILKPYKLIPILSIIHSVGT